MFESLYFRGGVDDLSWRGSFGSLGLEAARRLTFQGWQPLPVLWGGRAAWRGRDRPSFAVEKPPIAVNAQRRFLRVVASGLRESAQSDGLGRYYQGLTLAGS